MRGQPQGCHRSVDRGTCRPGIELRNNRDPECRRRSTWRKATPRRRYRKPPADSAQSETPGMHGNSTRENRETPSAPVGRRGGGPVGEGHEPEVQHARRWGVGRSRSTGEVPEQRWATAGGGHGGKATDQGEHRAGDRAPDTEPDRRVERLARCARSSTQGQADTVHRAAAPRDGRSAAGQLLRAEARGGARSGRHDVAGVRDGPG